MSESDAFFAPWSDQDIPNFDLGLDLDELFADDFDDLNDSNQDGGALTYIVEDVKQRRIAKFNVQGFEFEFEYNPWIRTCSLITLFRPYTVSLKVRFMLITPMM